MHKTHFSLFKPQNNENKNEKHFNLNLGKIIP